MKINERHGALALEPPNRKGFTHEVGIFAKVYTVIILWIYSSYVATLDSKVLDKNLKAYCQ